MTHTRPFAELQTTSNFSFLRGASHPHELIERAHELGYYAIALTDHNTLAGIVRAHCAAKDVGMRYVVGTRLTLECPAVLGTHNSQEKKKTLSLSLLVYPIDRLGYGNLCTLLTLGKRRSTKGTCSLSLDEFCAASQNLLAVLVPPHPPSNRDEINFLSIAKILKEQLSDRLSIALTMHYDYAAARHRSGILQIAEKLAIRLMATNDVHYHIAARRPLQDVVTCIRERTTIQVAGFRLFQNAERYLKQTHEIARLFRNIPQALERSVEIASQATFSLDQLRYEYPNEICPHGKSEERYLRELVQQGAQKHFHQGLPEKIALQIEEELHLIHELGYEKYFLTCHDIVRFARSCNILCQGRGAAANSVVCFCLGITSVDPSQIDLLFARFISKERSEPPDIDIDFEHERREEVIQYIYQKYGRHRAGLTAEVITYRRRSAVRDVGKALGLSHDVVDKLAKSIHRWIGCEISAEWIKEIGLNPSDRTLVNTLVLSSELLGFPRHLSQHVGGFIISKEALSSSVPILNASMEDRTIIEWDKDDIEALGMLKIDILALGMLSCIRKALALINQRYPRSQELTLATIPMDDPAVYDMICAADTVGVFQIESRAQMSMLPRLKPRCFYDLVIEVAIVRPGPIQGNMVHPFLKRRNGLEKVSYPDKTVEQILGKTLGVPLFQEQAMRLAILLAGFSPGEAERLRRTIAAWKRDRGVLATFRTKIVAGMMKKGYSQSFAETCFQQLHGFSEYGFPESHAASFALLAYASAWVKHHYPAIFAASLINSQPMGFYSASQIVRDVTDHKVTVLPIDVNCSDWDCTLEKLNSSSEVGIRLGFRLIKGLAQIQVDALKRARSDHHQGSIFEVWKNGTRQDQSERLRKSTLHLLARADAFGSMNLGRREAMWEILALPDEITPVDAIAPSATEKVPLRPIPLQQAMFQDYETTGLSLKAHPISFLRNDLNRRGVHSAAALRTIRISPQEQASVAGIGIVRQRPGTAKGVVFITLEDETGVANLIIRPAIFERFHDIIIRESCLLAHGKLERANNVVYLSATSFEGLDRLLLSKDPSVLPNRSYSY